MDRLLHQFQLGTFKDAFAPEWMHHAIVDQFLQNHPRGLTVAERVRIIALKRIARFEQEVLQVHEEGTWKFLDEEVIWVS